MENLLIQEPKKDVKTIKTNSGKEYVLLDYDYDKWTLTAIYQLLESYIKEDEKNFAEITVDLEDLEIEVCNGSSYDGMHGFQQSLSLKTVSPGDDDYDTDLAHEYALEIAKDNLIENY